MSLINYIEHLAGKDKLEIEFSMYDYFNGYFSSKYIKKCEKSYKYQYMV